MRCRRDRRRLVEAPFDAVPALADAIAAAIPQAERQTIDGQTHMVDPKALAPVLVRFFSG